MNEIARKRTKIVATIGPASRDPSILRQLFFTGVNVVRLNFSHGTHEEHGATIADVRRIAAEIGAHIAVLADLPGPKVRTGPLASGLTSVTLLPGSTFTLTTEPIDGTADGVSVTYAGLARDVVPGTCLYLADGAISLRIEATSPTTVTTTVVVGGELRPTQGINYPDGTLQIDAVTDRDFEHLAFALGAGIDWVAVSFVRSASDIERVRAFIKQHGGNVPIIAKIEKHEALECIDEIVRTADAVMVARGDLGIEIPLEQVPLVQKDLIARANRANKPVITATQMLESMTTNARPTRAETTDVANAILDGTDAVMLSGETARGAYPVEAVRVMTTIAQQVEASYPHEEMRVRRLTGCERVVETMIAEAAGRVTQELSLRFIVTGTTTGATAVLISSFRPRAQILAMTPVAAVAHRLALVWGVETIVVEAYSYLETLIALTETRMLQGGLARSGEEIAITSGMPVGTGKTNVLKVHRLP
ncbi:MAG TPA: pyruvate kinase [Candidatus Acidoferrales bacterium]|nr:pyruvate kinase [Candidatus Acidoferrales bacterium]